MATENKNRDIMRYAGLGTQWMVMLLLAVWAGWKLDAKTGWKFPIFIIILPLIALVVSFWQLLKTFNKPKK
ncbi:MAG: AtpZ/AtpI family protein [Chitinophagales bacterium]|nr:AtpZ/AtpI family protein [Chitinophagaceae bacterium]MCB9064766.1 AtpZ/AtpI family protein [Chitinophagales bacterium]